MASAFISRPGTKCGPCKNEQCGHIDCAESRRMAAAVCSICGKPIGYMRMFNDRRESRDNPEDLVHRACLEEEYERESGRAH